MKLNLNALREGWNPLQERVAPDRLELDPELFRAVVSISGGADWSGTHADVKLNIQAPASFVCDRCVEEFERTLEARAEVRVLMEDAPRGMDEFSGEGVIYAGRQGTVADLTDEIVNAILLEVPLQRLCREDCKGICPVCYANLNERTCEHAEQIHARSSQPRGETIADKLRKKRQQR